MWFGGGAVAHASVARVAAAAIGGTSVQRRRGAGESCRIPGRPDVLPTLGFDVARAPCALGTSGGEGGSSGEVLSRVDRRAGREMLRGPLQANTSAARHHSLAGGANFRPNPRSDSGCALQGSISGFGSIFRPGLQVPDRAGATTGQLAQRAGGDTGLHPRLCGPLPPRTARRGASRKPPSHRPQRRCGARTGATAGMSYPVAPADGSSWHCHRSSLLLEIWLPLGASPTPVGLRRRLHSWVFAQQPRVGPLRPGRGRGTSEPPQKKQHDPRAPALVRSPRNPSEVFF